MATSLGIFNVTPSSVLFEIIASANDPVYFKKNGATGADLDLSSLVPGPLRTYLDRLPPFAWTPYPNLAGVNGRVLRWSRAYPDGNYYTTPVEANVIDVGPAVLGRTLDMKIEQAGPDGQWFSFTPGSAGNATFAFIELRYIRSQNR